jgi:glycine/D-amino acid oxidase-like deaminating enzyme/nitrite reductase/ring-hydroxylating ferredoxin subunit
MLKSDEGKTISYWEATEDLQSTEASAAGIQPDVCVIGGGIAGLTTAYLLSKQGRQVTVIDDGLIGGGETSRTTAHLSNAIDDRIYRIEEWHGADKAKLAVEAHTAAIQKIGDIVNTESIDCDLLRVDGYLFEADDNQDDLDRELEAAHRCGLTGVRFADVPVASLRGVRCLIFPDQGQFHVLKYISGLAAAIERNGGTLISNTRVLEWSGGDLPSVTTADGRVFSANSIVLATNYPLMSKMFTELPAYRTYAVGLSVPAGSVTRALYWNTADPYKYIRTQPDGDHDLLIVGGEDHRTGQENDGEERFENLIHWTRSHFEQAGEVLYRWSGQCLETHDGLAFIGRYSASEPNVFLITGDSGMGMTHGTIGGMLVSDLILGRENPWTDVFDPTRKVTQSIKEAIPEIIDSTVPYVDWVTGGDVSYVEEIPPGEGAVIRDGLSKIAVYRDENGELHRRSAVCSHMGCIVRFNSLEKTWDCPCHGSRYSTSGEVINSPAIKGLGPAE